MKQKGLMKKLSAILIVVAMTVSAFQQFSKPVFAEEKANELPPVEQFATVEQLKSFNTNDNDGVKNPAKIYFGGLNKEQWWIAGSQNGNLTVFAASQWMGSKAFEPNLNSDKEYSDAWRCTYLIGNPNDVYPNHYGASPLRNTLNGKYEGTQLREKGWLQREFTEAEQSLMNETTVYTNDTKNNSVYSTTDKLYLAYGDYDDDQYITVGTNSSASLNGGLRIDMDYWGNRDLWLRAPYMKDDIASPENNALIADIDNHYVTRNRVDYTTVLMPAFELNLSSVAFASAAPAATSTGDLTLQDTDGDGAFTLRYDAIQHGKKLGSALISYDKTKVKLTDVPTDTYLVVQNSDGAKAKQITNETEVSASDMGLTDFAKCKVWLETTDTTNRMTYATLAKEEQGTSVNITAGTGLSITSNNGVQEIAPNTAITDIAVEVSDGYYLPDDYIINLQGQLNGLTATKTDESFTISGTPTSDVNITLPQATKKVYNMTLSGNGTFTTTCVGYTSITANEFTITNNGNVDLENVNVSITGNDADKFELSWDNTTTIRPNGTIKVTVKPANDLAVNAYQATLSVSADNVNAVTTDLQFTVSEHDYNVVVTPPTCTEKGYTTYTCKNCSHSYIGDEVNPKGHNWGEWEIIDSPTCEQDGLKTHTCIDCGVSETENLVSTGHSWEDEYTVDKEPTCIEDGSKSIHCKNCDAIKDSATIVKLGHSFTNYVSDNNATCTKDGTKTAKCDRCDETDTLVDVGTMLEHEYEWVFNNDATCEKNGTETGTCKHCQTTVTREKADTALGHEFKNYVSDGNATCTENGTETAKCERCDKTDTRVEENSALGHKLGEWEVVKEPTAAETGTKERHCERCDYKETEIIPVITDEKPTTPTNPDKPNTDNKPNSDKGSPETGDQTNVGLFTALLSMSALGIAVLAILKKKKALEHK